MHGRPAVEDKRKWETGDGRQTVREREKRVTVREREEREESDGEREGRE